MEWVKIHMHRFFRCLAGVSLVIFAYLGALWFWSAMLGVTVTVPYAAYLVLGYSCYLIGHVFVTTLGSTIHLWSLTNGRNQ